MTRNPYVLSSPRARWARLSWRLPATDDGPPGGLLGMLSMIPGIVVGHPRPREGFVDLPESAYRLEPVYALFQHAGKCAPARSIDMACRWEHTDATRTLFPHQTAAWTWLVAARGGLLADDMGLGKQHPVDTRLLTPSGWRAIGEIAVGDQVIGSNGRPTRVCGVFPQGVKPSYRVRFSDGSAVEAGPEHRWTVAYRCGGRRWEELTLTTNDLRLRPTIVRDWPNGRTTTTNLANVALYLPMLSAPVTFRATPTRDLPITPYLLGALIANGCLHHGTPALATNARDWSEVAENLLRDGGQPSSVRQYGTVVRALFSGLTAKIRDLGLDCRSAEKFIPAQYMTASVQVRRALFAGLMDADGSISATRNKLTYHTTSPRLADDVRELVECLGGIASVRSYDRAAENKPLEFQVRMRLPQGLLPFTITRKLSRYVPGTKALPCRVVESVEYVRDAESVCISVEAPDALYAVEHAILTHNTASAACAADALAAADAPRLIMGPLFVRDAWRRELARLGLLRGPDDFAALEGLDDEGTAFTRARWWFCHYDVLHAWHARLNFNPRGRVAVAISDEIHHCRNGRSKRAQGLLLTGGPAPARIGLTGTPMPNRPADLWVPLTFVDGPKSWGHPASFRERYCGAMRDGFGLRDTGPTHVEELRARLEGRYLRRTKADAGVEMPPLTRSTIATRLSASDREAHDIRLHGFHVRPDKLVEMLLDGALTEDVLRRLHELRQITSAAKLTTSAAFAANVLEQGGSIVVFVHERKAAARLASRIAAHEGDARIAIVHGGMPIADRDATVELFQGGELVPHGQAPRCIVATYGALREGVTLTRASTVLLHDLGWVPDDLLQAEARVHRIGSPRPVRAVWSVADQSIDTIFARVLDMKATANSAVLGNVAATDALAQTDLAAATGLPSLDDDVQRMFEVWR